MLTDLILLGIVTAGGFMLTVATLKWPQVGLYLITVFAVIRWDFPILPPLMNAAGLSIYPEDAACAVLLLTVLARPQRLLNALNAVPLLSLGTAALLLASLLGGMRTFGAAGAINEFRSFVYVLVAVAWALNQGWSSSRFMRSMDQWAVVTGGALVLTAGVRAVVYGLGAADSFVTSAVTGRLQTGRILLSDQALLLLLLAIYLLHRSSERGKVGVGPILFVIVVLAAQHRSVWVATLVALAVLFLKLRGIDRARLAVPTVMFLWGGLAVLLAGGADFLVERLQHSIASSGTFEARNSSWISLLDQSVDRGLWGVLFGFPFGFGYERWDGTRIVDYAPHNWYLSVYLRMGALGLAIFLALVIRAARTLLRANCTYELGALLAVLVYCYAYSITWLAAPVFGWALASGIARRSVKPAAQAPSAFSGGRPRGRRMASGHSMGAGVRVVHRSSSARMSRHERARESGTAPRPGKD